MSYETNADVAGKLAERISALLSDATSIEVTVDTGGLTERRNASGELVGFDDSGERSICIKYKRPPAVKSWSDGCCELGHATDAA